MVRTDGTTDRTPSENRKTTESARSLADSGFTLIEILITLALLASGVLAVLQAWRFGLESSDRHRAQADVQNVLTSASELVMQPGFKAPDCLTSPATSPGVPTNQDAIASAYQDQARLAPLPAGWTATDIRIGRDDVLYWNGGDTGTVFTSTCYQVSGLKLTQITIRVTSPDGKATGTLQVVKSDV